MTEDRFTYTEKDAPGIEVLYIPTDPTPHEKPDTQGTITEHSEEK
jgi:hypothetical protein